MNIFNEVKALVKTEKSYTTKILQKLMVIERDKLYSELKYPSLFQYIVKELGYSEAEATIRVHAVRLMLKSRRAEAKIVTGKLSLSNAAAANKALQNNSTDEKQVERVVENAEDRSARGFKQFLDREFKRERKEVLVLEEYMLNQFDRLRKKYGDLSTLELIKVMLERELKDPNVYNATPRVRPRKNSPPGRSIPVAVKRKVYTGKCANCGVRHRLEYDHRLKYSHGGDHSEENIQMLCRSCNLRKETVARQSGLFT